MLHRIRAYIEKYRLLQPGRPVLVALSGGPDSVALAHILVRLGYPVTALHCNFHLRGDESGRDEAFARTFASQTLGIPFYKIDFDTAAYAARHHLSIEMAARSLRYAWFEEMRHTLDAHAIAVAHHRDDSVETLVMNLLRGSGLRGLTGIRPRNGYVVRPLLDISRAEIMDWIEREGLRYVTDSTNLTDAYTRNFIRHQVIPLLEEINPAARVTLARSAAHLAAAEPLYESVIDEARRTVMTSPREVSVSKLYDFPSPETVLYELLRPFGFTRTVAAEVFRSLDKISGKQFYSPAYRLVKDRDRLLLVPLEKRVGEKPATPTRPSGLFPDRPAACPVEPAISTDCPGTSTDRPDASTDGFDAPTDGFDASTDRPDHTLARPSHCPGTSTDRPDASTDGFDASTDRPDHTLARPSRRLGHPAAPADEGYLLDEKMERFFFPLQLSWEKIVLAEDRATFPGGKYPFSHDRNTAYFDYDKLQFPLQLRHPQPGDRFVPFGMTGRKKVSDYFTDRKFSRPAKESQWLLCSAGQIIWIVGERSDNRFRITRETKKMLVVKISGQIDVTL